MRKPYRGHSSRKPRESLDDLVRRMDKIDDYLNRVLYGEVKNRELLDFGLYTMQMPDGEEKDRARAALVEMIDKAIDAEEAAEEEE